MANKQQLQSAGDGTAVPAGYVGEISANLSANITNATYAGRGTGVYATDITWSANKGVYLVAVKGYTETADVNGTLSLGVKLLVSGTGGTTQGDDFGLLQATRSSASNEGNSATILFKVINVTSDATSITVQTSKLATSAPSSGNTYWRLYAVRIA